MMLRRAAFFLHGLLAPHVNVLGVRLRQVREAESLPETQFRRSFIVAAHQAFKTPLRVGGWPWATAAEELLVLDLQPADIFFDLT